MILFLVQLILFKLKNFLLVLGSKGCSKIFCGFFLNLFFSLQPHFFQNFGATLPLGGLRLVEGLALFSVYSTQTNLNINSINAKSIYTCHSKQTYIFFINFHMIMTKYKYSLCIKNKNDQVQPQNIAVSNCLLRSKSGSESWPKMIQ